MTNNFDLIVHQLSRYQNRALSTQNVGLGYCRNKTCCVRPKIFTLKLVPSEKQVLVHGVIKQNAILCDYRVDLSRQPVFCSQNNSVRAWNSR